MLFLLHGSSHVFSTIWCDLLRRDINDGVYGSAELNPGFTLALKQLQ